MAIQKPFFVVPLDLGTITTTTEVAGYPATNLGRHESVGLTWQAASAPFARGDFGSAQAVNFCSIISANAQVATTFRLRLGDSQGEVDGTADYDSGAQTFISPSITRKDGLYHSHFELPSTQTKRWWRIDIGGHSGTFAAGDLVLGQRVEVERFYNYDFEMGVEDRGTAEFTRFGGIDLSPGVKLRKIDFTLEWMTRTEFETSFRPMFEDLGQTGVVYCCFDPEASTRRQAWTYMGLFRKSPFVRGRRIPTRLASDFSILSYI